MLELIPDLPDQVLGIRTHGKVTDQDYEAVLVPAIESRLGRHRRLRLLYEFSDDFDGFTGAALWEDAKVGMRHLTDFERIAVVSDIDWINRTVRGFGFVLPGELRVYNRDDRDAALRWITAPAKRGKLAFELHRDSGILVLEPQDELEASDFDRVAREIDPYIQTVGGLNGVVIVAEEFPGWDDFSAFMAHFRFIREHHDKLRRVALVTGSRFLRAMPRLAKLFVAAEVRRFELDERDAAMNWVSAQ